MKGFTGNVAEEDEKFERGRKRETMQRSSRAEHQKKTVHPTRPPGPSSFSPLGHALAIQRDALHFTGTIWQRYGDMVSLRLLAQPATVLFHPDAAQHVLQKHHLNYDKALPLFEAIGGLLGNGLFTNNGKSWLQQQRLMQPMFHSNAVARFGSIVTQCTDELIMAWQETLSSAPVLAIPDVMARLSLDIMARALFSLSSPAEVALVRDAFAEVWPPFASYVTLPVPPLTVPTPRNLRI
jgi:cytochrome P450